MMVFYYSNGNVTKTSKYDDISWHENVLVINTV